MHKKGKIKHEKETKKIIIKIELRNSTQPRVVLWGEKTGKRGKSLAILTKRGGDKMQES